MIIAIISIISAVLVIGLDQLTKLFIYGSPSRSIIGNFLWFDSTLNTGAAFSIFTDMKWLLITISSVASVIIILLILSKKYFKSKTEKILFGVILGGTLSNLIDRCIFGGVRDFISLRFMNFAIFNIADMAIVFGAIILAIYILIKSLKKDKNKTNDKT